MKPKMVTKGMGYNIMLLRNYAKEIPDHAARTMQRAANRIVKNAKNYVPEDTGDLMNSIRIEKSRGARGRTQVDVIVGNMEGKVREVDLNHYAALVHESYELWAKKPSDKTKAKMARFPGKVGSGFLTRAASEEEAVLASKMITEIQRLIRPGTPITDTVSGDVDEDDDE